MLYKVAFYLFEGFVKKIVDTLGSYYNRNILLERRRRSIRRTVDYIEKYFEEGVENCFRDKKDLLKYAASIARPNNGLWLEFGVYKGESVNYLATLYPEKKIYGFDSFRGLPENWRQGFEKQAFTVDKLPEVPNNVKLISGWFSESIPRFAKKYKFKKAKISFVHIDCDLYSSTKTVFDLLGNKIVKGTVILFDEFFNYPGWENGEYKAFREFAKKNGVRVRYLGYCESGEQVALKVISIRGRKYK